MSMPLVISVIASHEVSDKKHDIGPDWRFGRVKTPAPNGA
jgi:hypothetical protein